MRYERRHSLLLASGSEPTYLYTSPNFHLYGRCRIPFRDGTGRISRERHNINRFLTRFMGLYVDTYIRLPREIILSSPVNDLFIPNRSTMVRGVHRPQRGPQAIVNLFAGDSAMPMILYCWRHVPLLCE